LTLTAGIKFTVEEIPREEYGGDGRLAGEHAVRQCASRLQVANGREIAIIIPEDDYPVKPIAVER
jgi:hypothetical protein